MPKRILSGTRPSSRLHIGHLLGVLENWKKFQSEEAFYMIADWHALTTEYEMHTSLKENTLEVALDYLASGLDPKKCTIFVQSWVKEHVELATLLGMITPLPWLERCPTYKEQLQEEKQRDLFTYGFLGYPVLQAADILLYQADLVPVGEDQLPHIELCREIARRFNHFYGQVFKEPQASLTEVPKLPGTDGRKMSKRYDNCIYLSDSPQEVDQKVRNMITDPARKRRHDKGHPEVCPVFQYQKIFNPGEIERISKECRSAELGCVECKAMLSQKLTAFLKPIYEKRLEYEKKPGEVEAILREGSRRASAVAGQTMQKAKEAVQIWV